MKCIVCPQENSRFSLRQFHRFPADAERREKWLNSIGFTINNIKNAYICSDHFTENDYYFCDTLQHSRRLKKSAIPTIFTQRNTKKNSRRNIQKNNQEGSMIEHQSTTDVQHESTTDIQHKSTTDIQHEFTMDIQHASTMNIQQKFTTNIQKSMIDIYDNSSFLAESKPVKKNDTARKSKQRNINDVEKVLIRTGKYNIECVRKIEFTTNQAWLKFIKYVNYNRYLHILSKKKGLHAQKKIKTLKSIVKTLKGKNFITKKFLNTFANHDCFK